MECSNPEPRSAQSISFDLLPEDPEPNLSPNIQDSDQLEYSMSYILTQQPQNIPITIAIRHQAIHPAELVLPRVAFIPATDHHLDLYSKIQHCLGQAQSNAKYIHSYHRSAIPEQTTSKSIFKIHLPPLTSRRCSSLPQQSPRARQQMPRKRSKTMLSIGLKFQLKENSECWKFFRGKQLKKIGAPSSKGRKKQFINNSVYRNWKDVKFGESLEMSFVTKKLTLCENISQYKKYLQKITENRQAVQHPSPRQQQLPEI